MKIKILFLLLCLVLCGCTKTHTQAEPFIPDECPAGIVPDRIQLEIENRLYVPVLEYWVDGTDVLGWTPLCLKDTRPGRDINTLYCNELKYLPATGQKETHYDIKLILDPNDVTEEGHKIITSECWEISY